jgi:very-short-patch-repair endonuclease
MANSRARLLRANPTDAEQALWRHLRMKQIGGHRFRHQHPIGPYVVDFVCLKSRLIVEVDGGQHNLPGQIGSDEKRTAFLERAGYRVLRFWNNEVLGNPQGVLQSIASALKSEGNA